MHIAAIAAAILALVGCSSPAIDDRPRQLSRGATAMEAHVTPVGGSGVTGLVHFSARTGGVTMVAHLSGLPAAAVRVVVHANGNCSSPNGFSAGPPWAPTGVKAPVTDRTVLARTDGNADLTVRIDGVGLEGPEGLAGRSVVVHEAATRTFEAEPDVRNGRIGCGVIGAARTLF